MVRRWLGSLLVAMGLSACAPEELARTQIMLVVDSDLRVPDELDEIVMHIDGPGGKSQEATAALGPGQPALPRSLGLVHQEGPLSPVNVRVIGKHAGSVLVQRDAHLAFRTGHTLVLPMHLVRSCLTQSCGEQTCTEYGCQSADLDPVSLKDWSGDEPRVFEEEHSGDGGSLAEMDASTHVDSGTSQRDSGLPPSGVDAGSDAGKDAGTGISCEMLPELCNHADDNCNGMVDEGFDLMVDTNNCGSCGHKCVGQTRKCCAGNCEKACQ
ncbi:MAG: hypothetical protein QM778_12320 [Myxococcales bacterium]